MILSFHRYFATCSCGWQSPDFSHTPDGQKHLTDSLVAHARGHLNAHEPIPAPQVHTVRGE